MMSSLNTKKVNNKLYNKHGCYVGMYIAVIMSNEYQFILLLNTCQWSGYIQAHTDTKWVVWTSGAYMLTPAWQEELT